MTGSIPVYRARGAVTAALAIALFWIAPAYSRTLDLPVRLSGRPEVAAPAYLGDRLSVRLQPSAARQAAVRPRAPGRGGPLGISALDLAAEALGGAWFEPEFRGEVPPPEGSDRTDFTAFYLVHLPAGADLSGALDAFASLSEVASAEPIAVVPVTAIPNDSLWAISDWFFHPPSRRDIHAPEAWDLTTGDTSIVIAIIDTGLMPYHPDLGGREPGSTGQLWANWAERGGLVGEDDDHNGFVDDLWGWDFVDLSPGAEVRPGEDGFDEEGDANDFVGHGTAVAGIVGAIANNGSGIAGTVWKARLMALRVGWASVQQPAGEISLSYAAQAVRYAARMGARVINCSFSNLPSVDLDLAVNDAARSGVLVVAAAGNHGSSNALGSRQDVLSVGAVDRDDVVAPWSNLAPWVDLCAPGTSIAITGITRPGTDSLGMRQPSYVPDAGGTSFAAPFVSGAAALVQARRIAAGSPLLDPMTLLLHLRETADDIASENPSLAGYGTGRLNLERAVATAPASRVVRTPGRIAGAPLALPGGAGGGRVALVTESGKLVIVNDATGVTERVVTLPGKPVGGLAAADMGGGFGAAMFVPLSGAKVAGYWLGGDPLPGWPVTSSSDPRGFMFGIALGDLDGDGALEVIAARAGGFQVWGPDGRQIRTWFVPGGDELSASVALADLDGAPGMEVVAATRARVVHVVRSDGSEPVGWPVTLPYGLYGAAAPVVTRFGDGPAPTVIVADGNRLHALRANGSLKFRIPLWDYAALDPALADMNGDGSDDVVVASGPWLAAFDSVGTMVWSPRSPYAPWTQDVPVVGYLRGTHEPAVVIRSARELMAFDPAGAALPGYPKPGAAGVFPVIADRGGHATELLAGSDSDSLLFMYDLGRGSWTPAPHPWPIARGNLARTGSREGGTIARSDSVPPQPVTDLAVEGGPLGIDLTWTAPADDGIPPRASSYEMRWSLSPLDETSFAGATPVVGLSVPASAGRPERARVTGLAESQRYYVALRSRDAGWNVSQLSNVVSVAVPLYRPARVGDLTAQVVRDSVVEIVWTATGDDSLTGRPQRYRIRAAGQPFDEDGFANAPIERVVPASMDGGATERVTVAALPIATPLWFALVAEDDVGLVSPMSNVVPIPAPVVRPAPIGDLRIKTVSDGGIELNWTAVGDDSLIGPPARYLVRAAPSPLDESGFASAPIARLLTPNAVPGGIERFLFTGLPLGEPVWIGVEAEDNLGLRSGLSNVIATTFHGVPPEAVADLTLEAGVDSGLVLRWSETGDDGALGRASRYRLAADTTALTQATVANAPFRLVVARGARGTQRATFAGLPLGRTLSIAVEAEDDIGALSTISNVISAEASLVRPARVSDLAVLANTDSTLTVGWTATGDDSARGRPARYELRADPDPLDEGSFDGAMFALAAVPTVDPGGSEQATFKGLPVRTLLYLVLEAVDDAGVRSALSNVVSTTIGPHPPATVSDLVVEHVTENGITFRWTASGDDGMVGQAQRYLLRGGPSPITASTFASAPIADTIAATTPAGGTERFRLGGVSVGDQLWFALKAQDRVGTLSGLSNGVSVIVVPEPPAAVSDLSIEAVGDSSAALRWTATGDDGTEGRPRLYQVRVAERPIDDAGFASAAYVREVEATVDAGGIERFEFPGLPSGRRLWVALKAVDAGGSHSSLSNVASTRTGVGGPLRGRSGAGLAALEQPSRSPVSLYWQSDVAGEQVPHTIELFDLSGRCVRRFAVGPGVGGVVTWDGRDERGARLGGGLYFARMADGSPGAHARIMLLP